MAHGKPTTRLRQLIQRTDRVSIAWYPAFTHEVIYAALWDFMQDFRTRGLAAWEAFEVGRRGRPYPHPLRTDVGETVAKQRELEERYLTRKHRGT
jgi:hypothetical protein